MHGNVIVISLSTTRTSNDVSRLRALLLLMPSALILPYSTHLYLYLSTSNTPTVRTFHDASRHQALRQHVPLMMTLALKLSSARTFNDASRPQALHRGSGEEPLVEEETNARRELARRVVTERRRR